MADSLRGGKKASPKYPIVLAHGLLGFAELKLAGWLPPVHYWFGIQDALAKKGIHVITTSVPASATIEERAAKLAEAIAAQVKDVENVNIVAHSMGGLDARYMISNIKPRSFQVRSLVTIATPHHGSAVADFLMDTIGPRYLPRLYRLFEKTTGLDTGAFEQLTTKYMQEHFNPNTPDDPSVRYFSYGATIKSRPPLLSPFRKSHKVLFGIEGRNDGLVSVESSKWGSYKGTLLGLNHLDLINWSNRLRWTMKGWIGQPQT
jgi:triacylglycerol lipase